MFVLSYQLSYHVLSRNVNFRHNSTYTVKYIYILETKTAIQVDLKFIYKKSTVHIFIA